METKKHSCIDCGVISCQYKDGIYPDFCLTPEVTEAQMNSAAAEYEKDEINQALRIAAEVELEFYCQATRVEEVIQFAKKMDAQKLGIATCIGLLRESRTLAKILRSHGFTVYGVGCKVGAVPKVDAGIDQRCEKVGVTMCNPILQAKLLNAEETDLNIVMGLCVGHDSLFYKYAEALTTTLVTKDRVLGHNPAAALYTSESYYSKLTE